MKKLLVLALVLSLTMLVSVSAMAAVHSLLDDQANPLSNPAFSGGLSWGGWYSIDKDAPYMSARLRSAEDFTSLGFEYYQNDFFHANVSFINDSTTPWDYNVTALKGSYLFDFGLFVGLDYATVTDEFFWDYTQTIISPGYRIELGDGGYAAISVDYSTGDEGWVDSGILGYDIDFKYFTDNAKFYGWVSIPNDDVAFEDTTQYLLAANFKVSDAVTVGGYYNGNVGFSDVGEYNLGATYTGLENLLLEVQYTDVTEDSDATIDLNGIYTLDKLKFGLQYTMVDSLDDGAVTLKFGYALSDTSNIRVLYRLENDSYDSRILVRWSQDL